MNERSSAAQQLCQRDSDQNENRQPDRNRQIRRMRCDQALHRLVNRSSDDESTDTDSDCLPVSQFGDGRISKQRASTCVVHNDQKQRTADPRRVGLPLEPVNRCGERFSVKQPDGSRRLPCVPGRFCRSETSVEPVEEQRVADPHDPRDDVNPSRDEVEQVPDAAHVRPFMIFTKLRLLNSSGVRPVILRASSSVIAPELMPRRKKLRSPCPVAASSKTSPTRVACAALPTKLLSRTPAASIPSRKKLYSAA